MLTAFQKIGKNTSARLDLLTSIQRPDNSVVSLRTFHDKIETCIRGLKSLGQCSVTYGDLLVPIILEKLPGEARRNLALEHNGDAHWLLPDLRSSIDRRFVLWKQDNPMRKEFRRCQPCLSIQETKKHIPKYKQDICTNLSYATLS